MAPTGSPANIDFAEQHCETVSRGQLRRTQTAKDVRPTSTATTTTTTTTRPTNRWHYKQTGVKSRPIKLLKHPIEHIERKILLTYLLGFLFKLIAILSGPLVVLSGYLLLAPLELARRSRWRILNLLGSRIATSSDCENPADWLLCPLSCTEAFWFRRPLINTVLLTLEGPAPKVEELRALVGRNLLVQPTFRKFLSRVESRGLPLYRSLYWRHLGLHKQPMAGLEEALEANDVVDEPDSDSQPDSLSFDSDKFSLSGSSGPSSSTSSSQVRITVKQEDNEQEDHATQPPDLCDPVRLEQHILADQLARREPPSHAAISRYVHKLLDQPLNMQRPLWQLRVITSSASTAAAATRSYLVFRCHQSLADGRSLSRILTDHLTVAAPKDESMAFRCSAAELRLPTEALDNDNDNDEDDIRLRCLSTKRSFVARVSSSSGWRSALFVGPLTVLLWVIWTFTRRKNNHLNRYLSSTGSDSEKVGQREHSRFHMTHYDLTRFWQIKQMTRSTVADVILCALSGALRDYLRKFNAVSNPPNLNASLLVDMRQPKSKTKAPSTSKEAPEAPQVNCTLVNVPLPISVEGSVPRLWELRDTMDELRTSADPWVMLGLQRFLSSLLPVAMYQRFLNYVALRNSSVFVSSIDGPQNMVEGWCVDLLQRTMLEAQQSRAFKTQSPEENPFIKSRLADEQAQSSFERRQKSRENKSSRLRLVRQLGAAQVASIHYCMQPPSSDIPISFNCITYHNKLFVTSHSRSLLVEDSQILVRLFFKHLDQLADTIAKRRSLVTIIRTPIPIEISCQPPSPDYRDSPLPTASSPYEHSSEVSGCRTPADEHGQSRANPTSAQSSPHLASKQDTDIRIELGDDNRCVRCKHSVCICRRRKSLFSFDQSKVNLANILRPMNLMSMKSALSNERVDRFSTSECVCGQRLLEELDEDETKDGDREASSSCANSPNASDLQLRRVSARAFCAKCRVIIQRSTLSLDASQPEYKGRADEQWKELNEYRHQRSSSSVDKRQCSNPNSAQLIVPRDSQLNTSHLSKSETDLLTKNRGRKKVPGTQRGLKDSWSMLSRRNNRKLSLFSKLGIQPSPRSSEIHVSSNSRSRNLFEAPVEMLYKHLGDPLRRRRSLATSSSCSHTYHSVVVKDEINADVSLRYQLDGPFLGLRSRRLSAVSGITGRNQRRASLIPFGLIHNSSVPKMFCDDNPAHL